MKKSKKYRAHAEECRALARNAPNEDQRRQLLELAESWGSLATKPHRLRTTHSSGISASRERSGAWELLLSLQDRLLTDDDRDLLA